MEEKVCKKCGVAKVITAFRKHSSSRDGHTHTCIACKKDVEHAAGFTAVVAPLALERSMKQSAKKALHERTVISSRQQERLKKYGWGAESTPSDYSTRQIGGEGVVRDTQARHKIEDRGMTAEPGPVDYYFGGG